MRRCPFPGCAQQVAPTMFACRPHWFSLAKPLRDTIWAAWNDYRAARISIDELKRRQDAVLSEHARSTNK